MKDKKLTLAQQDAAKRLGSIWAVKKASSDLTQEKVCALCGWSSQSTFSQFLNGKIPLSQGSVLKLSAALEVHPVDIYPELVSDAEKMLLGRDSLGMVIDGNERMVSETQAPYFPPGEIPPTMIKPLLPNMSVGTVLMFAGLVNDLRAGRITEPDLLLLKPLIRRFKDK